MKVVGRQPVNGAGQVVQLRGINRAIFESRCTYDANGDADGPYNQTSIDPMLTWDIDIVRVTFNEDCWLGINGLPKSGNAIAYRRAVENYVTLLRANGLYVILSNHFSAPGTYPSTQIDYMPDADHGPTLWNQVALAFRTDHGIIFDPINEVALASYDDPHPVPRGQWGCWRGGCMLDSVYGGRFEAAGLDSLIAAIRSQGATQPILVGGLAYNGDLSQLLKYLPKDGQNQLIASPHLYDFTAGNTVDAMFTNPYETIAAQIPVVIGRARRALLRLGDGVLHQARAVADRRRAAERQHPSASSAGRGTPRPPSRQASTARPAPEGEGGPLLIRAYNGTPTIMGAAFRSWFQGKASEP